MNKERVIAKYEWERILAIMKHYDRTDGYVSDLNGKLDKIDFFDSILEDDTPSMYVNQAKVEAIIESYGTTLEE